MAEAARECDELSLEHSKVPPRQLTEASLWILVGRDRSWKLADPGKLKLTHGGSEREKKSLVLEAEWNRGPTEV